jgi:mRNA-degrading endonuclease YafQ of YafQ-DinJ toxin-antitoxin module
MENINYIEIILNGFANRNNREHLTNYFYRTFKDKEKLHFEIDEFFNGCNNVIKDLKKNIEHQKHERKNELYIMLSLAKKENNQERIKDHENELKNDRPNGIGHLDFIVNLSFITQNKYLGFLTYLDIKQIELSLRQCELKLLTEKRKKNLKKISKLVKKANDKNDNSIQHPFKDPKTFELFNYIVDNWKYKADQKWADIFNAIKYNNNGKEPTYKNEYRAYIIKRFQYTGKFQFDYEKKSTNRHKQDLIKLIEEFSKK